MKKTVSVLVLSFLFLLITVSSVFACSMMPPAIELIDAGNTCTLFPSRYSGGAEDEYVVGTSRYIEINSTNFEEFCPTIVLTETDKEIIFDWVNTLKSTDYGYTSIVRQTDEEYAAFQAKMERVNSEICDCSKITFHERKGSWTVYSEYFKDSCSFSTACYQPPAYCSESIYFIPMLILIGGGILLAGIIVGIIFFIKKRRQ